MKKWLRIGVHLGGILPLLFLSWDFLRGTLGFNPIQTVLHRTGHTAVVFLLLSLTCTPIHKIFIVPTIARLRKPLGLYAALYAFLHFAAFAVWDYGLNFNLIWGEISEKPFILIGLAALFILIILVATSFRFWRQKLGSWWTWLQGLTYVAGLLVVLHYLLAVKGDLFSLQGAYGAPLLAGAFLILLLVLRFPAIYMPLRRLFGREKIK